MKRNLQHDRNKKINAATPEEELLTDAKCKCHKQETPPPNVSSRFVIS
jgi:hypothetical protein